jgi:hypothetical protein
MASVAAVDATIRHGDPEIRQVHLSPFSFGCSAQSC